MPKFGQLTIGTCTICTQQTEVIPADFEDQSGLKGHFCKKDFWDAVQNRGAVPKEKKEKKSNGNGTESHEQDAAAAAR